MSRPVELDHQPVLWTAEVHDEWLDGVLAAKLEARESAIAQTGPEQTFGGGFLFA